MTTVRSFTATAQNVIFVQNRPAGVWSRKTLLCEW